MCWEKPHLILFLDKKHEHSLLGAAREFSRSELPRLLRSLRRSLCEFPCSALMLGFLMKK
ncbi:hypothetical protein HMPREF7215_0756 [Pyramidobacter piscolens W5455]|uniref:Uncharacterized protein n=1 Tax=Pyramidobacter piscolens W5455 TaxID=352165 RepID=A0ABP2HWV1_9BACT|nr:hypothetical protein HMPREF7215_0756 [Pyramidobacter piscolens W5455]